MLFKSKIVGYFRKKIASPRPLAIPRRDRSAQERLEACRSRPLQVSTDGLRGCVRVIFWLLEMIGSFD
jgi:hypothetical protein